MKPLNQQIIRIKSLINENNPQITDLTQSENFKNWFKNSKIVDNIGKPLIVYHQTEKQNEPSIKEKGFDINIIKARKGDHEVPNGIFFKPHDKDIGMNGESTHMAVYLSIQNPLIADSRYDLMKKLEELDFDIHDMDLNRYIKEKEYEKTYNDLDKMKNLSREEYAKNLEQMIAVVKEWGTYVDQTAAKLRELITTTLKKHNYDGVVLEYDQGSFGRSTKTIIALYPEQIKSVDNNGEFNPSSNNIMKEIDKPLNEKLNQIKRLISINEEKFTLQDLDPQQQEKIYQLFKTSYEKSTGTSWDESKFMGRAQKWTFFGNKDNGFVAVREQNSGRLKLVGVAGNLSDIAKGIDELIQTGSPIWGMADKKMVDIMVRKYGFIAPPAQMVKMFMPMIPKNVFGGVDYIINDDGGVTFKYPDVGDATKYFFGNKKYFDSMMIR